MSERMSDEYLVKVLRSDAEWLGFAGEGGPLSRLAGRLELAADRIEELERLWMYPERWVVGWPNQEPVEEIHLTLEQHEALVNRITELEAELALHKPDE